MSLLEDIGKLIERAEKPAAEELRAAISARSAPRIASEARVALSDLPFYEPSQEAIKLGRSAEGLTTKIPSDLHFSAGRSLDEDLGDNAIRIDAHNKPGFKYQVGSSPHYGYVEGQYNPLSKEMYLGMVQANQTGIGVGKALTEKFANLGRDMGAEYLTGDIINPVALKNRLDLFGPEATQAIDQATGKVIDRPITDWLRKEPGEKWGMWEDPVRVRTRLNSPTESTARKAVRQDRSASFLNSGTSSARQGLAKRTI